ncbi:MAG: DUF2147 domain-containing protein [Kofleriaceae bacterium]|nr:DUF2147 domain-containing protein [Kofleriaceae bacterium]
MQALPAHVRSRSGAIALAMIVLLATHGIASAQPAPIEGRWHTPNNAATIEIYLAKDGAHYGKLVAADNPKAKPGTLILRSLKTAGDAWRGTIYAPERDRTLDVTVRRDGPQLKLRVSAGFRDKTIYWTRAQ